MKINDVFFCDRVSAGQFSKINIEGMFFSQNIALNKVPYRFFSNLVVKGEIDKEEIENLNLKLDFKLTREDGSIVVQYNKELGKPRSVRRTGNPPFMLFLGIPIDWVIPEYGNASLKIMSGNNTVFDKTFSFSEGESPNINQEEHIESSGFFAKEKEGGLALVNKIIKTGNKEIKIFDLYLGANDLVQLVKDVPAGVKLTLITGPKRERVFSDRKDIQELFPNLKVKISRRKLDKAHDRFIIINGTEFFHFGHSLADLDSGPLSGYRKLTKVEEIEEIQTILKKIEESADCLGAN